MSRSKQAEAAKAKYQANAQANLKAFLTELDRIHKQLLQIKQDNPDDQKLATYIDLLIAQYQLDANSSKNLPLIGGSYLSDRDSLGIIAHELLNDLANKQEELSPPDTEEGAWGAAYTLIEAADKAWNTFASPKIKNSYARGEQAYINGQALLAHCCQHNPAAQHLIQKLKAASSIIDKLEALQHSALTLPLYQLIAKRLATVKKLPADKQYDAMPPILAVLESCIEQSAKQLGVHQPKSDLLLGVTSILHSDKATQAIKKQQAEITAAANAMAEHLRSEYKHNSLACATLSSINHLLILELEKPYQLLQRQARDSRTEVDESETDSAYDSSSEDEDDYDDELHPDFDVRTVSDLHRRGRTDSTDSHRRSGAGAGAGAGAGTSDTPEARTRRAIARANLFAAIKKIADALNAENYAGNQQLLWELMWRCRGKDVQVEYANYLREAKAIPFDKAKIIVNNFHLPKEFAESTTVINGNPEALCKQAESLLQKLKATPEVELHLNAGDAHQHKAAPQPPLPEPVRRAHKPKKVATPARKSVKPKATSEVRKPKTAGDKSVAKPTGKAAREARKPKTTGDARKPKAAKKKATTHVSTTASNPRVGSSSKALLQQLENQYGATHLRAVYNIAKAGRAQARRATHYNNCGYAAVPASDITGHDTFSAFPQHYQRFHATFNGVSGTGPMVGALAALSATRDALRNLQVARHLNTQALSKSLHTKAKPHSKPKSKPKAKPHSKPKAKPHTKPKTKPHSKPKAKPAKAKTAARSFWSWVPGHSARKARKANRQVVAAAKQMERPTVRPEIFKREPAKVSAAYLAGCAKLREETNARASNFIDTITPQAKTTKSPDFESHLKKQREATERVEGMEPTRTKADDDLYKLRKKSAATQKESTKQPSRWQSIASAWPGRSAKKASAANRHVIAAAKAMEMEEHAQVQEPTSHTVQSKMATFCVSTTPEPKRPTAAGWRRKKPSSWSDPLSNPDKARHTSRPCPQDSIVSRADKNAEMSEEGRRQLMKARLAHLEGRATAVSPRL